MNPFTEKEIIDMLKSIAISLKEIRAELADLNLAVRELIVGGTRYTKDEELEDTKVDEPEEGIVFEKPEEDKNN